MKNLTILSLLLSLIACADKKDIKPNELTDINRNGAVNVKWKKKLDKADKAYGFRLIPTLAKGQVFVASQSGVVMALDAETGAQKWQQQLDIEISAGPGVSDTVLAVASPEGDVVVLDLDSGTTLWQTHVSSEVLSPPVIDRNKVVVRTQDGRVYGFDIQSGQRDWVFDTNIPNLTLRGNSTPIARGGRLYVGFDNGKVAALNIEDGAVVWVQDVVRNQGKTEIDRIADIDGDIDVVATELYIASAADKTMSVATESGRVLWSQDVGSVTGVTVSRRSLYLSDNESVVHQLNRADGIEGWTQAALKNRNLTKPAFYLGDLLVGDLEGYVHVLNGENGEVMNRFRAGDDGFYHAPVVVGDVAYSYSIDGTLTAFSFQN